MLVELSTGVDNVKYSYNILLIYVNGLSSTAISTQK